jgi:hypothetical protein
MAEVQKLWGKLINTNVARLEPDFFKKENCLNLRDFLNTNRIIKKFIIEYKIQIRSSTSLTWRNC